MSLWRSLFENGLAIFSGTEPSAPECTSSDISSKSWALSTKRSSNLNPNDFAFTSAIIGLGAKLAKSDGVVSESEIRAFFDVFQPQPNDRHLVQRVFNLARQTVRGYQSYARMIAKRYRNHPQVLESVLDGLFHIACADGVLTSAERDYLQNVAVAFGFSDSQFARIYAAHTGLGEDDPYGLLGLLPSASFAEVRQAYRKLIADNHPDRLIANGAPRGFEVAAHKKAAMINAAYAKIRDELGQSPLKY